MALPVLDAAGCCTPLLAREPLDQAQAEALARVLKAVADPTRLRLLSLVAAHDGGEACVCELTEPLGLTQPTVSHHLKVLVDTGLLTRDKRGVWAYYALVPNALDALAGLLAGPVLRVAGTGWHPRVTGGTAGRPRRRGRRTASVASRSSVGRPDALLGATAVWGSTFLVTKGAIGDMPPAGSSPGGSASQPSS